MTAATERGFVQQARAALEPFPGRWPETLMVAAATSVALAVALTLQVPSFAAPNAAYIALQRTTVCTWRNLVRRLLILLAASVVVVPLGGFLVQTPWLLLPAFFLAVAALTYGVPASRNPVESILIAFPLVTVCFSGTYDVAAIAVQTRDLAAGLAIGVVAATVFARFSSRVSARVRLADAIAASFTRSADTLRAALERYDGERPAAGWPEAPVFTDLGGHAQLLDLVRQEGLDPATDRTLVTLATAAERVATYAGTVDTLSRQDVPRVYRSALRAELDAIARDLLHAFDVFARAARRLGTDDALEPPSGSIWPDFAAHAAALRARQVELRSTSLFAAVGIDESTNTNALVQSLASVGDVLHTPPWQLRDLSVTERLAAPPVWPFAVLPLDRFALRYALQVALGATIALVIGIAAHVPELSTLLWNPILVAQISYGATIRKAWLRLGGVVVGGALALLTMIGVFANSGDVALWLLVLFLVVAACQYAVLGMPVHWYGPFQVAVTYFVVLIGAQPTTHVDEALWRAFGTFAGTAILFAVFRVVAPDYAGRQLVARFADLLRLTLRYLPAAGTALPPEHELLAARVASARASADILRLTDEVRLEGPTSGVDPRAAVEAAGLALRVSLRAGLIARGRASVARPALEAGATAALEGLHAALREHLVVDLALLGARHTMATPGTRAHDDACRAAEVHVARRRPELDALLAAVLEEIAAARAGDLLAWPAEASCGLLAEVEHLRRMVQLVPRLDAALGQMVLPDAARARHPALAAPPALAGAAVNRP